MWYIILFKGITNQKMIFPHNQDTHEWNRKKYILAYESENLACIHRFKLQKTIIYRLQRPFSSSWEAICSKLAHETHKIVMNHSWLVYHNDAFCVQAYRLKLFVVGFKIPGKNLNSSKYGTFCVLGFMDINIRIHSCCCSRLRSTFCREF